MRYTALARFSVPVLTFAILCLAGNPAFGQSFFNKWKNGPPTDENFLPIGVWAQHPNDADEYSEIGVNTYVHIGAPDASMDDHLRTLQDEGIYAIDFYRDKLKEMYENDSPLVEDNVVGWIGANEPDNADPTPAGQPANPPIDPKVVREHIAEIKEADPTRPVQTILGRGVGDEDWVGRGFDFEYPSNYPEYIANSDITAFDIYPAASYESDPLHYVGDGVERLRGWSDEDQTTWNVIEASQINGNDTPTRMQMRSEAWMSIVNGSRGLVWFSNSFSPNNPDALLDNPTTRNAVSDINTEVRDLASVINSPPVDQTVEVGSSNGDVPLDVMLRHEDGDTYIFAVAMRDDSTEATFTLEDLDLDDQSFTAHVLNEKRSIELDNGQFTDDFEGYGTHLYRIEGGGTIPEPSTFALFAGLLGGGVLMRRRCF